MSDIMPNGPTPKSDWTDDDYAIFETWIRGILYTDVVQVTFTKVDGTERTMKCTLNPELLPLEVITENKKERKKPRGSIAVYEVDLQAWRSFRTADVKSITFSLGEETVPFPTGPKP